MKIGIIGTGFIVHTFIDAAKQHKDITLQAVYSRSEYKAKEIASLYDIPSIYTTLPTLLQDTAIDCIYIASPNALHYQQALAALQAGKHVICEKPFTSTPEEVSALLSLAKEKHLFLFEAITTIHLPNYKKIASLLPLLGNIKCIQCNFSQYSSRYDAFLQEENPNIFNPTMSGGALMDLNIYNLHFVLGLFHKPKKVSYFANKANNGIDTSGVAILQYEDCIATCIAAKDSVSKNNVQIQGDKGYIFVSNTSMCKEVQLFLLDGTKKTYRLQTKDNHLYYELQTFITCYQQLDFTTCYSLLEHSLLVLQTATDLRYNAHIFFPADNKKANDF